MLKLLLCVRFTKTVNENVLDNGGKWVHKRIKLKKSHAALFIHFTSTLVFHQGENFILLTEECMQSH